MAEAYAAMRKDIIGAMSVVEAVIDFGEDAAIDLGALESGEPVVFLLGYFGSNPPDLSLLLLCSPYETPSSPREDLSSSFEIQECRNHPFRNPTSGFRSSQCWKK